MLKGEATNTNLIWPNRSSMPSLHHRWSSFDLINSLLPNNVPQYGKSMLVWNLNVIEISELLYQFWELLQKTRQKTFLYNVCMPVLSVYIYIYPQSTWSERLLFNTNWAIFQLYYGGNKLNLWHDDDVGFVLDQHFIY
jgi:hypothetical protein